MNVEIRKHGMYSQYILLCGFFLSVEFFDMFTDINNLERKTVTEVLQMSTSNMLTCWASAGAELQLSKRWLMEILNFCKILFVLILVKIETH